MTAAEESPNHLPASIRGYALLCWSCAIISRSCTPAVLDFELASICAKIPTARRFHQTSHHGGGSQMNLSNYVSEKWQEGSGPGEALVDPVTGDELARISSQGVDVKAALEFARSNGGPALRALTYRQRADLLSKIAETLAANRDEYFRISLLNLGANQADASFDVDGAIYTMKY